MNRPESDFTHRDSLKECDAKLPSPRRRAILSGFVTAFAAGLAGCSSSSQTESATTLNSTTTPTGDGETATESGTATADTLAVSQVAEGYIPYATEVNGKLTYITGRNGSKVVYDGTSGPTFDRLRGSLFGVSDGIAYAASAVENNTRYGYLRRGGQQIARVTLDEDVTDNQESEGEFRLVDVLNDKLVWRTPGAPGGFNFGQEQVTTEYDSVGYVTAVGDEIGYIGYSEVSGESYSRSAVVVGGSVLWEGEQGIGAEELIDVSGTPAFIVNDGFNGPYVQYGSQSIGKSYTRRSGGDVRWIGEVNGNLAAVIRVSEDNIQNKNRDREDVLWYNGTEVTRHERIAIGQRLGPSGVGDELAYFFGDPSRNGIVVGGELIDENAVRWASVDGELAYVKSSENKGDAVIYQGRQTKWFTRIEQVFEVDGKVAFRTQTGADDVGSIMIQS